MATAHADTISNVLQIVADLRGESSVNTNANRVRAVSRAERDFARRKKWDFFHLKNQTVSGSGVNAYTVGTTTYNYLEHGLSEVFVSSSGSTTEDTRHDIVDFNRFKLLYNLNASEKLVYEYYDTANDLWKMYISPAPEATDTITYSHFWIPAKKTSATDTVHAPDMRILAYLALADIFSGEDEDDKSIDAKNMAEQLINEVMGASNSPNVNQLYSFSSITNAKGNRGLGSY